MSETKQKDALVVIASARLILGSGKWRPLVTISSVDRQITMEGYGSEATSQQEAMAKSNTLVNGLMQSIASQLRANHFMER